MELLKFLCFVVVGDKVLANSNKDYSRIARRAGFLPNNTEIEESSYAEDILPKEDVFEELFKDWITHNVTDSFPSEANSGLKLNCGAYTTGGQDNVDVAENVFAVADGVGGSIVSPSSYARGMVDGAVETFTEAKMFSSNPSGVQLSDEDLADNMFRAAILRGDKEHEGHVHAAFLENGEAFDESLRENRNYAASSTLLFGFLSENGQDLLTSNVGDGGISVLRRTASSRWKRTPVLTTKPINSTWNCPTQLETFSNPQVDSLEKYRFPLQEGDIIVAGSDGMLDNMYMKELQSLLSRAVSPNEARHLHAQNRTSGLPKFALDSSSELSAQFATPPGLLAKYLALVCRFMTLSPTAWSPFTLATANVFLQKLGAAGKADDVTVSVCWVEKAK